MTTRTIAHIEAATNEQVGSFNIKNALPTRNLKQVDPFLLIHHLQPTAVQAGDAARIPPHPHAGFEVMTYLMEGSFFHRDSKGHDQVAGSGDINWMTAGAGIVHSEGPSDKFAETGGNLELLQVWINLPASRKFEEASFHNYPAAGFPVIRQKNSTVKVLLGSYEGHQSPIVTQTPMFFYHLHLNPGAFFTLPVQPDHSSALYLMRGKLKILNETIEPGRLVDFHTDGDQMVFAATEPAEAIVFGGLPIKEKVVSYGPFVMNSFGEVQQAIGDYEKGKMGQLAY